jgi:hypothetical protein
MAVLIEGMEMPKDRPQLLWVYPNGKALTVQSDVDPWKELQAVPVPLCGRLIDADALLESIEEARKNQPEIEDVYTEDYFMVAEWLASAPTIIPASEEGET